MTGNKVVKLSEHFFLSEIVRSDTAARRGIDNSPPPAILARLRDILAPGLEVVRVICGNHVVHVTSGYRCPELNAAIGSIPTSAHVLGYAADIQIPACGTPAQVARILAKAHERGEIEYDQLIFEFGSWVHISFDPRMRCQNLTYKHGDKHARLGIIVD